MRFILGNATNNQGLNENNKAAAYRQTIDEHEKALHKFEEPSMSPTQRMLAAEKGEIAEKSLPQYWDDEFPRLDVGGSSSFINEVEYIPSLGIAVIKINGNQYYYPKTAKEVGDLVTAPSIGGEYNRTWKLKKK